MSITINKNEVEFSPISVDEVGSVFFWKNRVFRAIKTESVALIKDLFVSGLIKELVEEKIFPASEITSYSLSSYGLVIEHERISPVTLACEWSFSMLQDAALAILKVNNIARRYGFQTKDCHTANLLFDGYRAKFVDLGSFVKLRENEVGWLAFEDFLRLYYFPLKMWARGNYVLARSALVTNRYAEIHEYIYHFFPITRIFNVNFIRGLVNKYFLFKMFSHVTEEKIKEKIKFKFFASFLCYLLKNKLFPCQKINFNKWTKKIENIKRKELETKWGEYHTNINIEASSRFKRVGELVKVLKINSVIELGGNQGFFSQYLQKNVTLNKIVCTDYEEQAVDVLHNATKKNHLPISAAVLDFIFPDNMPLNKPSGERFKQDVALVLAVLHHLILTQNIPITYIFKTIKEYTGKYVMIEFMPLGLHSDNISEFVPTVPSWYTLEWFRQNFVEHFDLITEEKLEINRIIFVGKIKQ
jgi:hypothetical protein